MAVDTSKYDVVPPAPGTPTGNLVPGGQADLSNYDVVAPPQQYMGPLRTTAMFGSNVGEGGTMTADIPIAADQALHRLYAQYIKPYSTDLLNKYAAQPALSATVGQPPGGFPNPNTARADFEKQDPWANWSLTGLGQRLGLLDNPALQPRPGTYEPYVASGGQAIGGALATGGGANLARNLFTAAGAGLGGQGAADLFPEHPELARLVGTMGGGLAFGSLGSLGAGTPSKTYQAYKAAGIDPVLGGDVTGNQALQMIQKTGQNLFGGGRIVRAAGNAVDQFGNAVEDLASTLSTTPTADRTVLGTMLQNHAVDWLDNFRTTAEQMYTKVRNLVPANTPITPTNYSAALDKVTSSMPGLPSSGQRLTPDIMSGLKQDLTSDLAASGGQTDFANLSALRTRIGRMLSNRATLADPKYQDLDTLYDALTKDLQGAVAGQGKAATDAFNAANDYWKNGRSFMHDVLDDMIGPKANAGTAFNSAATGSSMKFGTHLDAIRQEMPQAADDIAAYKLLDMSGYAAKREYSPTTFATQTNPAHLPDASRAALFGDPEIDARLTNLRTVAQSMKDTEATAANTSKTGYVQAMLAMLGAPAAALHAYQAGGLPAAISAGIGPFTPGPIAGWIAANPRLTRFLARTPAPPAGLGGTVPGLLSATGGTSAQPVPSLYHQWPQPQ